MVHNEKVCNAIAVQEPEQVMYSKVLEFFHKLTKTNLPGHVLNKYSKPKTKRITNRLIPKDIPRTERRRRNIIFKGAMLYAKLPEKYKSMTLINFKTKSKNLKITENIDGPRIFEKRIATSKGRTTFEWTQI